MDASEFAKEYICGWPVEPLLASLKPCPFCNSRRVQFSDPGRCVTCVSCGADGPSTFNRPKEDNGREAAARLWNTRNART